MKNIKIVAILICALIAALPLRADEPVDWANHNRYAAANADLKQHPQVVFMGNSITDFWPTISPAFWAEHPSFCGRGISGQTSAQMLCRFRADVLDLAPQVVVILAGTNDIAQNQGYISTEHIVGNIMSMVELARGRGMKVAVCSVLPCTSFYWRKERQPAPMIRELNAMLAESVASLADPDVVFVDYYTPMVDEQGGLPQTLSEDGCHPTPAGYHVMEDTLLPILAPWIKDKAR